MNIDSGYKEELLVDLENMLQTWINCILYYRKVYPQNIFNDRTVYGIKLPTSKSLSLCNYLNNLISEIRKLFLHINCIKIELYHQQIIIESYYFYIGYLQLGGSNNLLQKQIEFKKFYSELKQLGNKPQNQEITNFKVKIEYRLEDEDDTIKNRSLLQKWIKRDNQPNIQKKLINSLKLPYLNVICQRIQ